MNKTDFLLELTEKLSLLPVEELEERWSFYSEIIDDRMDEGLSEEEAVAELGTVDEIADQILKDIPLAKLVKEKIRPRRRFQVWEILLLILGSPVWLPLLVAAFAVVLCVYIAIWAVDISLWAVFVSVAVGVLAGLAGGVLLSVMYGGLGGITLICAGIVCAGLSIFLFFACREITRGFLWMTKKLLVATKKKFARKEGA